MQLDLYSRPHDALRWWTLAVMVTNVQPDVRPEPCKAWHGLCFNRLKCAYKLSASLVKISSGTFAAIFSLDQQSTWKSLKPCRPSSGRTHVQALYVISKKGMGASVVEPGHWLHASPVQHA